MTKKPRDRYGIGTMTLDQKVDFLRRQAPVDPLTAERDRRDKEENLIPSTHGFEDFGAPVRAQMNVYVTTDGRFFVRAATVNERGGCAEDLTAIELYIAARATRSI